MIPYHIVIFVNLSMKAGNPRVERKLGIGGEPDIFTL